MTYTEVERAYTEIERQEQAARACAGRHRQLATDLLANPIAITAADRESAAVIARAEIDRLGRVSRRGGKLAGGYDATAYSRLCRAAAVKRWLADRGVEPNIYAYLDFMAEVAHLTPGMHGDRSHLLVVGDKFSEEKTQ